MKTKKPESSKVLLVSEVAANRKTLMTRGFVNYQSIALYCLGAANPVGKPGFVNSYQSDGVLGRQLNTDESIRISNWHHQGHEYCTGRPYLASLVTQARIIFNICSNMKSIGPYMANDTYTKESHCHLCAVKERSPIIHRNYLYFQPLGCLKLCPWKL